MTCKTSAVAVCCSSASRVSVNSRAFSIAMTACAAKFCNSAICSSENGRTSWRAGGIGLVLSRRFWRRPQVLRQLKPEPVPGETSIAPAPM